MPLIKNGQTTMTLLDNGAIGKIMTNNIMINQIAGNNLDGSFGNIFLRVKRGNHYDVHPMMGPASQSKVMYTTNTVTWSGEFETVNYQLDLVLDNDTWFWTIHLKTNQSKTIDVTYTQDLGLGAESFVKSNPAYASQYIDNLIVEDNNTLVIASRQNQSQSGQYPYLQQGSFEALQSYSTDAQQFFGTAFKQSGNPKALQQESLDNVNKQYESAYIALRTQQVTLNSATVQYVFYASFAPTQPENNVRLRLNPDELRQRYDNVRVVGTQQTLTMPAVILPMAGVLSGEQLTATELATLFPQKQQVETHDDKILSFFNPDGSHTVLPEKEIMQDRLSGNIVLSSLNRQPGDAVLATTQYITGVFESHTVYANSDFNMLSSDTRDVYNFFKVDGTRIFIKIGDKYRMLGMPSAFTMHYNGADWYYKINGDLIKVSNDASASAHQLTLRFESLNQQTYDILVATRMNCETLGVNYQTTVANESVTIQPEKHQKMADKMPNLKYRINYSAHDAKQLKIGNETLLFDQVLAFPTHQRVAQYHSVTQFAVQTGLVGNNNRLESPDTVRQAHAKNLIKLLRHVTLTTNNTMKKPLVERTNLILPWFAHDALVHLLSPHGLEQSSGAAWGTRDVCQGPTELFLATGHFDAVREIIRTVYSHQLSESGHWPQWFMFDEYSGIYANESHGDVVVWPLKVVADYILATNDLSILQENLPYMSASTRQSTAKSDNLSAHITKQIDYIENNFLYDTAVSAYGDGDWDDTLQPANPAQKREMASTWTEELTIEVFRKMANVLSAGSALQKRCASLADRMYTDFKKYFMQSDVLPGFIRMTGDHEITPIIYPGDQQTGINYRLLPLSQGVLSQILTEQSAQNALEQIKENLLYTDGVRLMDRPAQYHGGVSEIFKRAEQSANFGREIGLLYVHAHIRYAEAIAVSGNRQEAWRLLDLVNPINLSDRVPNAEIRQANVYFSSSDANFNTRYDAQEQYDLVSHQGIGVKGGWRLYSSGPGIFIGALLQDVLNLKTYVEDDNHVNELPFDSDIFILTS